MNDFWIFVAGISSLLISVGASAHAVLNKRDVRAAIAWVGLIWLSPFLGTLAYVCLGINRVNRKASRVRRDKPQLQQGKIVFGDYGQNAVLSDDLYSLANYVEKVTEAPLTYGNTVRILENGDQAYPLMLEYIRMAQKSVALCSYIFDYDRVGKMFVDALVEAVARGVEVRVLIDGVGSRYSKPRTVKMLRKRGVPAAEFMKSRIPVPNPYFNLRNHRKLLVIDGQTAFAGGMNIREGCVLQEASDHPVQDIHFLFAGPITDQIMDTFAIDWAFTTGEHLAGELWHGDSQKSGGVMARGVPDGPDEDFESIRWTILGALSRSRERVNIVSPYFLPDQTLVTALNLTAMRGVSVNIIVPAASNLRLVQWAMKGQISQLLDRGCKVWLSKAPFDHSKLLTVDGQWSLIGSANWDARSLRLNFEYNIECYSQSLAERLDEIIEAKIGSGKRLHMQDVTKQNLALRLRNGIARLLSPYL